MSVHIDELHTDVTATGPGAGNGGAGQRERHESTPSSQEQWTQAHRRVEWLAARVAAEGFDD